MKRRHSVLGALLLCAFCFCAFAAANASATTLSVCREVTKGTGKWEDSNCEKALAGGSFGTVATTPGTNTELVGTGVGTATFNLPVITPSLGLTVQCSKQATSGFARNELIAGVMENVGSGISFKLSECAVTSPAGQGCTIGGNAIEFKTGSSLTFMKTEAETRLELPPTGETMASISLEGCSKVPDMAIQIKGKLIGTSSGSTLSFSKETSAEGKLQFGGEAATLQSTLLLTAGGKRTMIE